jgi:hypothetical protein
MTSGSAEQSHGSTKELRDLRLRWTKESWPLRSRFNGVLHFQVLNS